jgi:hypothetical protein
MPSASRGKERLQLFVELKRHLRKQHQQTTTSPDSAKIVVYYMFYDRDNPNVCKHLPHRFVYDRADIARL